MKVSRSVASPLMLSDSRRTFPIVSTVVVIAALAFSAAPATAAKKCGDRVHRWGCLRLHGLGRMVRRDGVLYRQHAPTFCSSCRPDVELRLSAPRKR